MADAAVHGHGEHGHPGFFTRWFMSTNHKDIGILYLFTAALVGFISVCFTVYMRLELMNPGVQYMCTEGARLVADAAKSCTPDGHLWNVIITAHGILMMFFVVIPALFGGLGVVFVSKNWKIAVAPIVLMLGLFIFVPAINAGMVGIMVPIGVLFTLGVSRFMYKKGMLDEKVGK